MNGKPLSEENDTFEEASLFLSEESIAFCMEPGAVQEGSFRIFENRGRKVKGRIYTTHWRMQCRSGSRFQGRQAEISYLFDSTGMEMGDTVKGLFLIVSDAGEYRLPFAVTAQPSYITTPEGKLKNLSAFLSLAQTDLDAAYQAFSHPRFCNTLMGEPDSIVLRYQGLVKNGVNYQAMVAFLKSLGQYREPQETPPLKSQLKKFYAQNNIDYERREQKKNTVELFRLYLKFRSMALPLDQWAKRTKELLEALSGKGKYRRFYKLGLIHVAILQGDQRGSKKMLDEFAESHYDLQRNAEVYGYYLYLCACLRRSHTFLEQVCQRVRILYGRHPGSGILLWVLQMVDRELLTDDRRRCQMMEQLHNQGVRTPILYIEACMLYRQNPGLVGSLSDYEVQVLTFANRYHLLNRELMERVTKLALRYKSFSVTMYSLLEQCYQANPDTGCIHAICTLLIKGNKIGDEYFKWYEKGVQANLRITRLYDYYLYSMRESMDSPLPEAVLMYFQYNQDLDYQKKAYLFANLTKYRKQYPDLYDTYRQDMIDFVLRQLEKGRVNAHLICLYQEMVSRQYISQKNAYHVADFIFSYRIRSIPRQFTSVVVREPSLKEEITVAVSGGEAIIPIYTGDACVFFQDAAGGRQWVEKDSRFERWFDRQELLELCGRYCPAHPGIVLEQCRKLTEGKDPGWQVTLARITAENQFSLSYRMELWQQMLDHFYQVYDHDAIEWCLQHVTVQELPARKRSRNTELLLLLGHYEEAFAYISTYGCERIPYKPLIRMCSHMICQKEFTWDENLVAVCREVFFRGKYDEIMLTYLLEHMDGGTAELQCLWQAGQQFGLDTYQVEKKLIARALITKFIPDRLFDIFESYYRAKGRENLVLGFLTYFAGEAVRRDLQIDSRVYQWIRKELVRGELLNETCRIGWLYGVSQDASLLEGEEDLGSRILDELICDGRYFAFYSRLPEALSKGRLFLEQSCLEYKTDPSHRVYLHYRIQGQDQTDHFGTEEMEQSFGGIFVKELLLFAGDRLQYYITEQTPQREWVAASGVMEGWGRPAAGKDRFEKMEQLLGARDRKQQEELAEAYVRESCVAQQFFQPL